MPVTLDLSDEVLARLRSESERRGVTMDELVAEFVADLPPDAGDTPPPSLRFIGIGRSADGRRARDLDEMLAEGFGQD